MQAFLRGPREGAATCGHSEWTNQIKKSVLFCYKETISQHLLSPTFLSLRENPPPKKSGRQWVWVFGVSVSGLKCNAMQINSTNCNRNEAEEIIA